MSPTRCARRRPSLFLRAFTLTGVSAVRRSTATWRRNANERTLRRSSAGRAAAASSTDMKWIRYGKYTGDDLGLSADDLLKALADFFLESGFQNQYMGFSEWNQHTLEDLKKALQQALESGSLFDNEQA